MRIARLIPLAALLSALVSAAPTARPLDWRVLFQLGLDEGISKEQLPDVRGLLAGEKIEVFVGCRKGITIPTGVMPERVGKWQLVRIDQEAIERRSASRTYDYLRICPFMDGDQPRLRLMVDTKVPPGSDLIVIDRGILDLWFILRDGVWKVEKSEQMYG